MNQPIEKHWSNKINTVIKHLDKVNIYLVNDWDQAMDKVMAFPLVK